MAGGIDWFRWHHGSVTDPKFALVARRTGASLPDVLAVWAYLLEHASAADVRGTFAPIDFEAWDCLFGFPDGRTKAIHDAMQDRNLVDGGAVTSWEKRQPKREREDDLSTERSRAFRQRQKEEKAATERQEEACNAAQRQETPREEKRREEEKREIQGAPEVFAPPEPGRATKKCPRGFVLTPELLGWATEKAPGVDPHAELEKLKDHTFSRAISDWAGAWRNWMRKAHDSRPSARGQAPPGSYAERRENQLIGAAILTGTYRDPRAAPKVISPETLTLEHDDGKAA